MQFIVRSAMVLEDGLQQSLAGHFWSSEAVTAEVLPATIAQAWAENTKVSAALGLVLAPQLMVQTYIPHHYHYRMHWHGWKRQCGQWRGNYARYSRFHWIVNGRIASNRDIQ